MGNDAVWEMSYDYLIGSRDWTKGQYLVRETKDGRVLLFDQQSQAARAAEYTSAMGAMAAADLEIARRHRLPAP